METDVTPSSELKIRLLAVGVIVVVGAVVALIRSIFPARVSPPVVLTAVQTVSVTPARVAILLSPQPTIVPILPTPTPTQVLASTATTEPAATEPPTPLPSPTLALPEEHYIENVRGHKQYFPLGCETSLAVDWAAFFGVDIVEYNFQYELPKSDNPDLGFVGDVRSPWGQIPPYGYGVHAGPVADLLREKYDLPARAVKNYTLEEVRQELASGQPVIAWVIGNMVGGVPAEYTDSQGNKTIVAAYEHVVMLTGYNQKRIRYNNNGKFYEAPNEVFLNSWGVLGNMALIYDD